MRQAFLSHSLRVRNRRIHNFENLSKFCLKCDVFDTPQESQRLFVWKCKTEEVFLYTDFGNLTR